jgi:hypothetical protein
MSTPNVLHQRMPRDDHPGAAILLEAPHRSQPGLQSAVISLNAVVAILLRAMPRRRQQLLQDGRYAGAWSVATSIGVTLVALMAWSKKRRAAMASGGAETNTSMTCPNWSTAVVELANLPTTTLAEVADATEQGIQRVCKREDLVVGFLARTGLTLDP